MGASVWSILRAHTISRTNLLATTADSGHSISYFQQATNSNSGGEIIDTLQVIVALIGVLVTFSAIFITVWLQLRTKRKHLRRVLTAEIERAAYPKLLDSVKLARTSVENIDNLEFISTEFKEIKSKRPNDILKYKQMNYYKMIAAEFDNHFPDAVFSAVIGELDLKNKQIDATIDYYNHLQKGRFLFETTEHNYTRSDVKKTLSTIYEHYEDSSFQNFDEFWENVDKNLPTETLPPHIVEVYAIRGVKLQNIALKGFGKPDR
ncbi:hypothetical protein [Salinigranum sp. GCM10025319]|uniref:hypothetical protein n=1 Tax=Salinigranum sp. GCM10025319 TaxID=3252687 RepID=UPI00361EBF9D